MQSASHLACDWWKQHPSFWRWLPSFIDGQESKCEDFWFSISSCPFIVILAINREFLSGVHTPFFSPSRHYSTLPSFQAKSHNSPRCSEKWATWNGVGGDIIHQIPEWCLWGNEEKEERSPGLGDSISSLYTDLKEPRFKMNYLFQPFMSLWQMAVCLLNVNSALPLHSPWDRTVF